MIDIFVSLKFLFETNPYNTYFDILENKTEKNLCNKIEFFKYKYAKPI